MPFLLLLLLAVSCLPVAWPRPPEWVGWLGRTILGWFGVARPDSQDFYGSILLTWLSVVLIAAAAFALAQWTRRELARDPGQRETVLRRQGSARFYHLLCLLVVYGLSLYVFGWGWVAQGGSTADVPADPPPGSELLVLVPFLAALVLSWAGFYDAERALHEAAPNGDCPPLGLRSQRAFWSRWSYVTFHLRQNLALLFAPLFLLIIVNDLPRLVPHSGYDMELAGAILTVGTALATFACMPWIMRLVLGLKPMPAGALRNRLAAAARRLKFRCNNILIWNTRGGVVNAMVMGILPMLRYIVLTDRLVAEMTPDEVEAVFGHEVGHVKHRHIPYYLGFLLLSLWAVTQVWTVAESMLNLTTRKDLAALPLVGMLGAYIFLVFGFLSRRCERQADIYGCRTVSCAQSDCSGHEADAILLPGAEGLCPTGIRTFIDALEKVAYLNGISRERPGWLQSWQHSTIARRVDFLRRVVVDPTVEPRFQRRVVLVKWVLFLSLVAVLLVLASVCGWDTLKPF
jgi:Zn-dependent protease with chaperone function